MDDNCQDRFAYPPASPLSEVGLPEASQEQQQRNMAELIRALQESNLVCRHWKLPEYNPDSQESDAQAWFDTVIIFLFSHYIHINT